MQRLLYSLSCCCRFLQSVTLAPTIYQHPELNGWYESLHSGKGPCCDGSDAKRVDDADWETKDGHYRVRIDSEWVDVPNEAVVDGPNRAGRTMVWPYYLDGHPKARCFMPGSMG
jgi:hypothetical protein